MGTGQLRVDVDGAFLADIVVDRVQVDQISGRRGHPQGSGFLFQSCLYVLLAALDYLPNGQALATFERVSLAMNVADVAGAGVVVAGALD